MSGSRVNVLGVGISAINLVQAEAAVAAALGEKRRGYVCITGVHGVSEAQDDPEFRRILNAAFLCTPDGMPMVWVGKLSGQKHMTRVYGPDLMLAICERSVQAGWKHFFYGGSGGAAATLQTTLEKRFPGLKVVGTYEPPFRPLNATEESALIAQVHAAQPDIIWVGLSTPKQEKFMAEYLPKLDTTLMFGVGAAFDFHIGRVRQAPRWMQRSGLEWLFRLCQEPRRLAKRYLRNNPLFLLRIFAQFTGIKKYPLE